MSTEATTMVLGLADAEQAEYAAASAHKTSVSPSSPRGEADPDTSDVGAAGAAPTPEAPSSPAAFEPHSGGTEAPLAPRPEKSPQFAPVDSTTGDLLDLIAEQNPATPQELGEWEHFVKTLREVATATGLIDQNAVRPLLRGEVKPQRVGAFYHRATKAGLIRAEGWNTSNDLEGKNSGKPTRVYRLLAA